MLNLIREFFWESDKKAKSSGASDTETRQEATPSVDPADFSELVKKAAAQVAAPITNTLNYLIAQSLPANGRMLTKAEVAAENTDGSITVAGCSALVQTASGELVKPEQAVSRCSHKGCNQVEAAVLRCEIGGEVCCYLHSRQILMEGKERIVCEKHLQEILKNWDAWAEYDRAHGIDRLPSGAPPQPVAVKIEPRKPVFSTPNTHGPQKHIE